jgi:hypothetical protein
MSLKTLFHFFFFLIFGFIVEAQTFASHKVTMLPKISEQVFFDEAGYKREFTKRYREKFNFQATFDEFAELCMEEAKEYEEGNKVCLELVKETKYLNEVMRRTIPSEYISDNVKVRIIKDPSINAFSLEDGSINIHIGLLTVFDNEAQLAAVISHEFGHYFGLHMYKSYKKYKQKEAINSVLSNFGLYGAVGAVVNTSIYFKKSRSMETESDLYAINFFRQNKYNPLEIAASQKKLLEMENIDKEKIDYVKGSSLFDTHPATNKRIKYLADSAKHISIFQKKDFLVDSVAYSTLKTRANDEIIYSYFVDNNFDDCIYLAYKMHLYHPNDEFYLYFLTEALFRKLDVDSTEGDENFITQNFRLSKKSIGKLGSVHCHLRKVYGIDAIERKQLPNQSLADSLNIEFITNTEALNYFKQKSTELCNTCYAIKKSLGKPFSNIKDTVAMTELEKYIYDQEFFRRNDTLMVDDFVPVFFNTIYSSKKGKNEYTSSWLVEDSWEMEAFKSYYNSESKHKKNQMDYLFYGNLNYRESQVALRQFDLITEKLISRKKDVRKGIKKGYIYDYSKDPLQNSFEMKATAPELYLTAQRHKFKKFIYIDLLKTTKGSKGAYAVRPVYNFVDLEKNNVIRQHGNHLMNFGSEPELKYYFEGLVVELLKFKGQMEK